ncbi:MAG: hypothetical protein ACTSR3_04310 [Candidatus Helarchaeota archaeon]
MKKSKILFFLVVATMIFPIFNISIKSSDLMILQTKENSEVTIKDSYPDEGNNTVIILLNNSLNSSFSTFYDKFLRFLQDIQIGLACNVSYYVYDNTWNASDIRNFLNNTLLKFGLRGAILLGQVPAFFYKHSYNMGSGWQSYRYPWDYYYMDLNCVFNDTDLDGTADNMTGNIGPEIWVSRIDASGMTNELNLYEDFFDRNHLARNVGSRGAQKGLLWIDDDWYWDNQFPNNFSYQLEQCMGQLYPSANRTTINNPAVTWKPQYLYTDLQLDYEWLWLCMHSYVDAHQVNESGLSFQNITWQELNNTAKNMTFYNLYSCTSGNFTYRNCIGEWYIFGNTDGQVAIAPGRPGGFWYGTHDFFNDLSMGRSVGDAWKNMWARGYTNSFSDMFPPYDPMGHNYWWWNFTEGTNLFGDATLQNCPKGTIVRIDPLPPIPPIYIGDNVTVTATVESIDDWASYTGWSLYNVTLEFWMQDSNYVMHKLGDVKTDINGRASLTFNTSGFPAGQVELRVYYNGSYNFYQNFGQLFFTINSNANKGPQISPELILLLLAANQSGGITDILFSPVGIAAITAGAGFIIVLFIINAKKRK